MCTPSTCPATPDLNCAIGAVHSVEDPSACCPQETQKCTCIGNTSTTDIKWHKSIDYTGRTEGLATCDTCDNALEEWNGFEEKCTDIDECARNRFQYFLKIIPRNNFIS